MTKKNYRDKNSDLDTLSKDIKSWFTDQGYEVQSNKTEGAWAVQAQKTEGWRKVVGASRAFNILIQGQPNDFYVEVGTGEWASNLTAGGVAALLTGGTSVIVSGLAASWSKKIESDLWSFIDQKTIFGERVKSEREITVLKAEESVGEKLKQLKDAFDQGFIDEVAYQAKKLEIENQSNDKKKNAELNEKLLKLKKALDAGILTETEYETKKAELIAQSSHAELDTKTSQLRAALASGILSQQEFDAKIAEIQKEIAFSEKLKQLENARNAGIITNEEFAKKKAELLS
ncbi:MULTISPECIES: SHOCT domain-containing protein [unclassified Microcoleus]|uniref:SHOCT domain-containing protein n=1 Tax=unclassified Microcoleus TaxID=2642155 RepID=UPI002FD7807B